MGFGGGFWVFGLGGVLGVFVLVKLLVFLFFGVGLVSVLFFGLGFVFGSAFLVLFRMCFIFSVGYRYIGDLGF